MQSSETEGRRNHQTVVIMYTSRQHELIIRWAQRLSGVDLAVRPMHLSSVAICGNGSNCEPWPGSIKAELDYSDLIFFKERESESPLAAALALYLRGTGLNFVDESVVNLAPESKLTQYVRAAAAGIPIPRFVAGHTELLLKHRVELLEYLRFPVVLKGHASHNGRDNYWAASPNDLLDLLTRVHIPAPAIIQEYVPGDRDYRVLVFGGTPAVVIERFPPPQDHRSNLRVGGTGRVVPTKVLPEAALRMAVVAAAAVDLDVAGVDLKHGTDGNWQLLEVNSSPQLASGSALESKMKELSMYLRTAASHPPRQKLPPSHDRARPPT